jgi:transcriptional regulator with XRE-family HTH domain
MSRLGSPRGIQRPAGLGQRLEARRMALRLSVHALAARSGYARNTVSHVLAGENVHLHTLETVAEALGLSVVLIEPQCAIGCVSTSANPCDHKA